jgi:predicted FMN-binding regulatory protein PaiB
MIDISDDQKWLLKTYTDRLARVEQGEVWGRDHPGPYSAEEKVAEIQRIKTAIDRLEEDLRGAQ